MKSTKKEGKRTQYEYFFFTFYTILCYNNVTFSAGQVYLFRCSWRNFLGLRLSCSFYHRYVSFLKLPVIVDYYTKIAIITLCWIIFIRTLTRKYSISSIIVKTDAPSNNPINPPISEINDRNLNFSDC